MAEKSESRENELIAFLGAHGFADAKRKKIAGDASFRRYERVLKDGKTAILMDAPPSKERVQPFIYIAKHLKSQGFSAPEILAEDIDKGFLLLEDFGDVSFSKLLAKKRTREKEIYTLAVELLAKLHTKPLPEDVPAYDPIKLTAEVLLLPQWYYELNHGEKIPAALSEEYKAIWEKLLPKLASTHPVLVLRDYHADNLMLLDSRQSIEKVGLLDFQDAVSGHAVYDLASLLEDARRDVSAELTTEMFNLYLELMPPSDPQEFKDVYAIFAAQRNCKILGIFARLWLRDKKINYLPFIPRVWRYLENDLKHPALADLKAWLDKHFTDVHRRNVPVIEDQ